MNDFPATGSLTDSRERLIVALDFSSAEQALELVDRLDGSCKWFKVGMELFYAAGVSLVETLRARDFSVFLDLKLHDIPNTVAGAIRSVTQAGASLLTVHASGGEAMLTAAAEAANAPGAPKLLAVTVLTSMDAGELAGVGVMETPAAQVLRLARLAKLSGINGMVCSANEVRNASRRSGTGAMAGDSRNSSRWRCTWRSETGCHGCGGNSARSFAAGGGTSNYTCSRPCHCCA